MNREGMTEIRTSSAASLCEYSLHLTEGKLSMTVQSIPGTYLFDSAAARRGYALNQMCYSFNDACNREAFKADEASYCAHFGLNESQISAVRDRDVLRLISEGGNVYYLAKFAGILGLNVQDLGALQTGLSVPEFKAKLASYAHFNQSITRGYLSHG
jgi:protocatechuate 4,5-dioxygenase alpha chain